MSWREIILVRKFFLLFTLLLLLSLSASAQLATDIAAIRDRVVGVACTVLIIIEGVVGFLAVLMFILAAIRWIVSDDPGTRSEIKQRLIHIIIGVVIVIMALELANVIARAAGIVGADQDCNIAGVVDSTATIRGFIGGPICVIIRLLQAFFGIIGMGVLMIAGITWMTSDDPGQRIKARSMALNAILGLLILMIGIAFLNALFNLSLLPGYDFLSVVVFTCPDVDIGQLDDFAKYTVCMGFFIIRAAAGFIAVIIFMIAGIILMASDDAGLRNKAKGMAVSSIIGVMVVIVGAQFITQLFGLSLAGIDASSFTCGDPPAEINPLLNMIRFTLCVIFYLLRAIAGIIAVLMIIAAGIILMASENASLRNKAKSMAIMAILGAVLVIIGAEFFFPELIVGGNPLEYDCDAVTYDVPADIERMLLFTLCTLVRLGETLITVIAVITLMASAFVWMTSGSPEARASAKIASIVAVAGFLVAIVGLQYLGELIGGGFLSFECLIGGVPAGIHNLINTILCILYGLIKSIVTIVAAIMILFGGFMMVSSESARARSMAKNLMATAIIGFIIALIAVQFIQVIATEAGGLLMVCPDTYKDCIDNCIETIGEPDPITGPTGDLSTCLDGCRGGGDGSEIMHLVRFAACLVLRLIQLLGVIAACLSITLGGVMWLSSDDPHQRGNAKKMIMLGLLALIVVMTVVQLINAFLTASELTSLGCETDQVSPAMDGMYTPIYTVGCYMYRVIQYGGIFLALIILIIAGLIWMGSDSPQDRQRAKTMALSAVIGLLIIMSAIHILGAIVHPDMGYSFDCNVAPAGGEEIYRPPDTVHAAVGYVACIGVRILQVLAIMLLLLITLFSGARFLTSDSPEEKAKAKGWIIHAVIGFLFVFVAMNLVSVIITGPYTFRAIDCTTVCHSAACGPTERTDITPVGDARTELDMIVGQVIFTVCLVALILYAIIAALGAVVICIAGVMFFSSDDPVRRNRAKGYVLQVIIGAVIVLLAVHVVTLITTGAVAGNIMEANPFVPGATCTGIVNQMETDGILGATYPGVDPLTDIINKVLCMVLFIIQTVVGILVLLVFVAAGFRWGLSDTPEERSAAKRMIIYGIVGVMVVFLATNIIFTIFNIFSGPGFEIKLIFVTPGGIGGGWETDCDIDPADLDAVTGIIESTGCIIYLILFFLSGFVFAAIIVYSGIKWIVAESPADRVEARWILLKAIIGFVIIMVAAQAVMTLTSFILSGFEELGGFWSGILDALGVPYFITCWLKIGILDLSWSDLSAIALLGQLIYIFCTIVRILQAIAIIAAGVMIAIAGIRWIGSDSPEQRNAAKWRIFQTIVGLAIVLVAFLLIDGLWIVNYVFDLLMIPVSIELHGWFCTPAITQFVEGVGGAVLVDQIQYIGCVLIRTIQGVAAMIAMFVITVAGYIWLKSESFAERSTARERIIHALIGLAIVIVVLEMVNLFIGGVDLDDFAIQELRLTCDDPPEAVEALVTPLNTIVCLIIQVLQALVGGVAILYAVYGGYQWMVSDSPEGRIKARNRLITVVVGLAIILLAFELVRVFVSQSTFLSLDCDPSGTALIDCSAVDPDDDFHQVICAARTLLCFLIKFIEAVAAAIGALLLVFIGYNFITSTDPADRVKIKNRMVAIFVGLFVIIAAFEVVNVFIAPYNIMKFEHDCARADLDCTAVDPDNAFDVWTCHAITIICIIIRILQFIVGVVATVYIMYQGYVIITSEDPSERRRAKNMIFIILLATLLVILSSALIQVFVLAGNTRLLDISCGLFR